MPLPLLACIALPFLQQLDSPLTERFDQANGSGTQIFGASVACTRHAENGSGYTVVFGAPGDDTAGLDAGAVYLIENGVLSSLPNPSDTTRAGDQFGQVAIDRNTLVVGAGKDDVPGFPQAGSITVYNRGAGNVWTEDVEIDASSFAAQSTFSLSEGDQFGAVGIHGDRIIVGASLADSNGLEDAGAAFVLERTGGSFNGAALQRLQPTYVNLRAGDLFGSVAIWGDTAVVGARGRDAVFPCNANVVGGCDEGAAFVFERNSQTGQWNEAAQLTAQRGPESSPVNDRGISDEFGFSVAIHHNVIVVGAPGHDGGCGSSGVAQEVNCDVGAVYVYERGSSGTWSYKARLQTRSRYLPGGQDDYQTLPATYISSAFERFGYSVAVFGGRIVIGAPGRFLLPAPGVGFTVQTGAAYIYERDLAGDWLSTRFLSEFDFPAPGGMMNYLGEPGAFFGSSVAASGSVIGVGAPFDSSPGPLLAGKGYTFYQVPDWGRYDFAPTMPQWQPLEHRQFCFGDGGDQAGCTDCPCGNNAGSPAPLVGGPVA